MSNLTKYSHISSLWNRNLGTRGYVSSLCLFDNIFQASFQLCNLFLTSILRPLSFELFPPKCNDTELNIIFQHVKIIPLIFYSLQTRCDIGCYITAFTIIPYSMSYQGRSVVILCVLQSQYLFQIFIFSSSLMFDLK